MMHSRFYRRVSMVNTNETVIVLAFECFCLQHTWWLNNNGAIYRPIDDALGNAGEGSRVGRAEVVLID